MKNGLINYQQGMLLKPQHFQMQNRLAEEHLNELSQELQPYFYGVADLKISRDALSSSTVTVSVGSFLFSDGAFAHIGQNAVAASRTIPDELLDSGSLVGVYIGLRRFNDNSSNARIFNGKLDESCDARYVAVSGGDLVNDLYGDAAPGNVEMLKYNLRIFFENELDALSDFDLIKICEVYRDGTRIMMSDRYVPPVVNFFRSDALVAVINDISALIISKTRVFEKYKHIRTSSRLSGYEIMLLSIIGTLCDASATLQTIIELRHDHPSKVWSVLARIIAILSPSCPEVSSVVTENRFPSYDHNDLYQVFSRMRDQIRLALNCLTVGPEYVVRFVRKENGVWTAELPDLAQLDSYDAYLAMSGQGVEPDRLSLSFWRQLKLSSADAINDLIVRSLSGIPISITDRVQGGLPSLDRGFYSVVDVHNDLWNDAVQTRSLAMFWEAPEDAELVLYIVRNY